MSKARTAIWINANKLSPQALHTETHTHTHSCLNMTAYTVSTIFSTPYMLAFDINAKAVLPNGKVLSVAESCTSRDGQQLQKNRCQTQSIRTSRPKNFPDLRQWSCGKRLKCYFINILNKFFLHFLFSF